MRAKTSACKLETSPVYFAVMILKYIPNILTLTRLVLIAPFLFFLIHQEFRGAFFIFAFAGFTDALDGWLARYFNWQSAFGSFIDPIADKLLITISFIALALTGKLPWWLVLLVLARDITISAGVIAWHYFIQRKLEFQPTYLSKINTVLQLLLVTLCLFEQAFFTLPPRLNFCLIILTALTTLSSYIDYVWTWGNKACIKARTSK